MVRRGNHYRKEVFKERIFTSAFAFTLFYQQKFALYIEWCSSPTNDCFYISIVDNTVDEWPSNDLVPWFPIQGEKIQILLQL